MSERHEIDVLKSMYQKLMEDYGWLKRSMEQQDKRMGGLEKAFRKLQCEHCFCKTGWEIDRDWIHRRSAENGGQPFAIGGYSNIPHEEVDVCCKCDVTKFKETLTQKEKIK